MGYKQVAVASACCLFTLFFGYSQQLDVILVPHSFRQHFLRHEERQRLTENQLDGNSRSVNVTVTRGDTAFLPCRVRELDVRLIAWRRCRDWQLLTLGKVRYTSDSRFDVLHAEGSNIWTLKINYLTKKDSGTYECQVHTGTEIVSYLVHLLVQVPEAFIRGNGKYHVELGSPITLVCIIENSPDPSSQIYWFQHYGKLLNNSDKISVHTEPGIQKHHSRLTIRDARESDSGVYTCRTRNAQPDSIDVYVIEGPRVLPRF